MKRRCGANPLWAVVALGLILRAVVMLRGSGRLKIPTTISHLLARWLRARDSHSEAARPLTVPHFTRFYWHP